MSDFIYSQQCDELIDGQYFDGQYVPTEQDLADMNQAWGTDMSSYMTNCDYCGEDAMCFTGEYGATCCNACAATQAEFADVVDTSNENFFCANCGHVELVGYALSPDSSLCCDCYQYNRDNDCDDYIETEADVYQDSSYYDEPNGWSDHLEGYDE